MKMSTNMCLNAALWLADLQEQRQVGLSQVKVPPTGQHAVNHLNEGEQQAVGSAPFWRQAGELDRQRRRPTILQETHRAADCTGVMWRSQNVLLLFNNYEFKQMTRIISFF